MKNLVLYLQYMTILGLTGSEGARIHAAQLTPMPSLPSCRYIMRYSLGDRIGGVRLLKLGLSSSPKTYNRSQRRIYFDGGHMTDCASGWHEYRARGLSVSGAITRVAYHKYQTRLAFSSCIQGVSQKEKAGAPIYYHLDERRRGVH
jgi:hypothetical protein